MQADKKQLEAQVRQAVEAQRVIDMHAHLYPPAFGTPTRNPSRPTDPDGLLLYGIEELLTYHYLVAELYRVVSTDELPYEAFWRMTKQRRAELIWQKLFLDRPPVSEACRGVLTTLKLLGLDPAERDLAAHRDFFERRDIDEHIDDVMRLSGVDRIVMTNEIFRDNERRRWEADPAVGTDPRFAAVLRVDPLLRDWPRAAGLLSGSGYPAAAEPDDASFDAVRRFLDDWLVRTDAVYVAMSLPPTWQYPATGDASAHAAARAGERVLERAILPACRQHGIPLALMIGSTPHVNPALHDAGFMNGKSDTASIARLCAAHPDNRFFITTLSREDQHGLCVVARKFGNLMPFGCWWFLNNPSIITEITRMRLEMLGTSFVYQHSDARVLEQVLYKWHHSRELLVGILTDHLAGIVEAGWPVDEAQVRQVVFEILRGNVEGRIGKLAGVRAEAARV